MKKFALLLMLAVALSSCDEGRKQVDKSCDCERAFSGKHELALQNDPTVADSGSYMIIANNFAKYMWKSWDSTYIISTIPVGNVRVQIDETVTQPYVKYRWVSCNSVADIQRTISTNVVYIVIVCSSEDCPAQLGIKSTPEQPQL